MKISGSPEQGAFQLVCVQNPQFPHMPVVTPAVQEREMGSLHSMTMLYTLRTFSASTNNFLLAQNLRIKVLGKISILTSNTTSCQSLGLTEVTPS